MKIIVVILLESILIKAINITEDITKEKPILTKYQSNKYPRCTGFDGIGSFIAKTSEFVERNQGFGEFLNSFNVSECSLAASANYVKKHVLDGLIIHDDLPESHWWEYKTVHKKVYTTPKQESEALRKWRNNLRKVAQHNREYLFGKQSYTLHLNHFGDLDVKEYFNKFLKLFHTFPLFDPAEDQQRTAYRRSLHHRVPRSFDWRHKGFKPRLEEQHQCGACYAFAVTHALQAQLYKKHGFWGELSSQQIVDCSFKDGNAGCDGGSIRGALRYVAREGLIKESLYPYVGKCDMDIYNRPCCYNVDQNGITSVPVAGSTSSIVKDLVERGNCPLDGHCKYDPHLVRVRARRWATLPAGDEAAMERTLATIGPLAVAVNAAPFTFQLYRSGIYDDLFCAPWLLNHAMLLVGYTPEYWILLNWWGKNWGEDGYIRIRRGLNRCGVTNMATYVEV